jgi:hypothetical protein
MAYNREICLNALILISLLIPLSQLLLLVTALSVLVTGVGMCVCILWHKDWSRNGPVTQVGSIKVLQKKHFLSWIGEEKALSLLVVNTKNINLEFTITIVLKNCVQQNGEKQRPNSQKKQINWKILVTGSCLLFYVTIVWVGIFVICKQSIQVNREGWREIIDK